MCSYSDYWINEYTAFDRRLCIRDERFKQYFTVGLRIVRFLFSLKFSISGTLQISRSDVARNSPSEDDTVGFIAFDRLL